MHPGAIHAPSFITEILPCCLGIPLYVCAVAGIACLFSKRVKSIKYPLAFIFLPFAVQLLFWNDTFRASRFAYSIVFFLVLMAGLFNALFVSIERSGALRRLGVGVFAAVFVYTLMYSLAYTTSRDDANDGRVKTAQWLQDNVPRTKSVGMKSKADLPRNQAPN